MNRLYFLVATRAGHVAVSAPEDALLARISEAIDAALGAGARLVGFGTAAEFDAHHRRLVLAVNDERVESYAFIIQPLNKQGAKSC